MDFIIISFMCGSNLYLKRRRTKATSAKALFLSFFVSNYGSAEEHKSLSSSQQRPAVAAGCQMDEAKRGGLEGGWGGVWWGGGKGGRRVFGNGTDELGDQVE